MSDNDVKAEQESVQKELNYLTLDSDDESGNSSDVATEATSLTV